MNKYTVRCDHCGWSDTLAALKHFRAWYRAPCPECAQGEIIDAQEVRLVNELILMESWGWINPTHGGGIPATIDSRDRPFNLKFAD
jgi:predicted RNA-binding Zn-ribbon protein involved in translation (DUF1610 family)